MSKIVLFLTKKIGFYTGLLGGILWLAGCQDPDISGSKATNINDPIREYTLQRDLIYGRDKSVTFDLYRPNSVTNNPAEVIILLHGGGWISGDKSFLQPTIDALQKEKLNLALVNLNYRVKKAPYEKDLITTQVEDLQAVIRFLNYNAEKYNIRKDNYRVMGISAGGHIALTYAYSTKDPYLSAVVALAAPTELSIKELFSTTLWPNIETLIGRKFSDSTDAFRKASPFYLAGYNSPKTILAYGQKDIIVDPQQGEILAKKLNLMRIPHLLRLYPDQDHGISTKIALDCILESFDVVSRQ